jgi:glycosyltransferase involved in cell wall biosynthesis
MFSIIIPAIGNDISLAVLQATVGSVIAQRHITDVIIVADDLNLEKAKQINSQYPVTKMVSSCKPGFASACNAGLAAAGGELISYLQPGDLVDEHYFADKIEYLTTHSECDACYGQHRYTDKNHNTKRYPLYTDSTRYAREHLVNFLSGTYLPQSSIVWRKAYLIRRAGHNEDYAVESDIELFVRSIFHGLRIIAVAGESTIAIASVPGYLGTAATLAGVENWRQVLRIRKKMFADLRKFSFEEDDCFLALGTFLFDRWMTLRHEHREVAIEFLEFAKKVCWPLPVKGGAIVRLAAMILGPDRAIELLQPAGKKRK